MSGQQETALGYGTFGPGPAAKLRTWTIHWCSSTPRPDKGQPSVTGPEVLPTKDADVEVVEAKALEEAREIVADVTRDHARLGKHLRHAYRLLSNMDPSHRLQRPNDDWAWRTLDYLREAADSFEPKPAGTEGEAPKKDPAVDWRARSQGLERALREYDSQIDQAAAHSVTALINKRLPAAEAFINRVRAALSLGLPDEEGEKDG